MSEKKGKEKKAKPPKVKGNNNTYEMIAPGHKLVGNNNKVKSGSDYIVVGNMNTVVGTTPFFSRNLLSIPSFFFPFHSFYFLSPLSNEVINMVRTFFHLNPKLVEIIITLKVDPMILWSVL